eukprot:m.486126 g.486126  ORF g.486126 m.486126 type:complete len:446 (+) comp24186_c0_seq1:245-1582(+)
MATSESTAAVRMRARSCEQPKRARPVTWTAESEVEGLTALTMTPTKPTTAEPDYRSIDLPNLVYMDDDDDDDDNGGGAEGAGGAAASGGGGGENNGDSGGQGVSNRNRSNDAICALSPSADADENDPVSPLPERMMRHRRQRSNTDPHMLKSIADVASEKKKKQTLAYWQLEKETRLLKSKLLHKAEECDNLVQYKEQLETEMDDLTTSLFEEAHNMVRDEKIKAAALEKSLAEVNGKAEVMDAELKALKTLVAHMQKNDKKEKGFLSSAQKKADREAAKEAAKTAAETAPLRPNIAEFATWYQSPSNDFDTPFLRRCRTQDVHPCLEFSAWDAKQSQQLAAAIQGNTVCITATRAGGNCASVCALCSDQTPCDFQLRINDQQADWLRVCLCCRNKVVAVCDLFMFLRHVAQGLVKSTTEEAYDKLANIRLRMAQARLGLPIASP